MPFYWFQEDVRRFIFSGDFLGHPVPQPKPSDVFGFVVARLISFSFFFVIPAWQGYTLWQIFIGLLISHMVYGLIVFPVFMLAHVVELADFPAIEHGDDRVDEEWAILQLRTTADFAPRNAFLNWYLGGLNYQAIHHLFPNICHIHYPKLAPIVAEVCKEYGVPYNVYDTFSGAIASHYRWLKYLGQPTVAAAKVPVKS